MTRVMAEGALEAQEGGLYSGDSSGLTVRCFRNDCRPDGRCPARGQAGGGSQASVRGRRPRQGVRPTTAWPAARRTGGGPSGSPDGHDNSCGAGRTRRPGPLLPQAAATSSAVNMVGVWLASAYAASERRAILPQTRQTLPGQVPVRWVRWLQEPIAGLAAAGGMQPAPMGASDPGGQAAAELATDIGHGWPGERAGLLEAEVVEL